MWRFAWSLAVAVPLAVATTDIAVGQETANDSSAAFAQATQEVKIAYSRIESLRTEYQEATEARRQEIDKELLDVLAETQQKVNAMVDAALEAFKADPMGDKQVSDQLFAVAEYQIVGRGPGGGGDQYEAALPLIETLVDGGHDNKMLPVWGALAAICANEFDLAEKFAKTAQQSGAFSADPGENEFTKETFETALRHIKALPQYRQRWEKEQAIRATEAAADDLPRVKLTTSKGDIVLELFENEAPIATANFLSLVKKGFYDGVVFHRVLPRFMAQGGDPTGKGTGGPGYSIACECYTPNTRDHFRGTLSMAHAGRDTGGSQFFLTLVPTDFLDGRHTAFGRVVEGIEVLSDLQRIDPERPLNIEPDQIVSAEVLRDRGHAYSFEKLPSRR